jgi:hypothetical protein
MKIQAETIEIISAPIQLLLASKSQLEKSGLRKIMLQSQQDLLHQYCQ